MPKSSTTSQISDFDASPIPQENFQSFTQAQSISARLNKSSVYNEQNIAFNTPKCYNVPQKEIVIKKYLIFQTIKLRDDALAKSPISRRGNMKVQSPNNFTEAIGTMKYTENSIKRIRQCEQFLQEQLPINKQLFSSEERALHNQIQESDSLKKRVKKLMERLRIVRQNIEYFGYYKGDFAAKNLNYQNYCALTYDNGLLLNEGSQLQISRLFGDTFKEYQICFIPDKSSHYTSLCQFNDRIILGSRSGGIFGWNMLNNQQDFYFDQHRYLNQSYATSLFHHNNLLFIGTQDNQLLALDERMEQQLCLSFQNQEQRFLRASSVSISPLKKQSNTQSNFDSPSFKPIDVNNEMDEVNFILGGMEIESECLQLEIPSFKKVVYEGIKNMDFDDNNVLATSSNGFVNFDIRNPEQCQFSYFNQQDEALKALFNQSCRDEIIYTNQDAKLQIWSIANNQFIYERNLDDIPIDIIKSETTNEIVCLFQHDVSSRINIYAAKSPKFKPIDEIQVPNFSMNKLILDFRGQCLYGIGNYSFRTWNFYKKEDVQILENEMKIQLEI